MQCSVVVVGGAVCSSNSCSCNVVSVVYCNLLNVISVVQQSIVFCTCSCICSCRSSVVAVVVVVVYLSSCLSVSLKTQQFC